MHFNSLNNLINQYRIPSIGQVFDKETFVLLKTHLPPHNGTSISMELDLGSTTVDMKYFGLFFFLFDTLTSDFLCALLFCYNNVWINSLQLVPSFLNHCFLLLNNCVTRKHCRDFKSLLKILK